MPANGETLLNPGRRLTPMPPNWKIELRSRPGWAAVIFSIDLGIVLVLSSRALA
jgi:hypothetical protein